MNGRRPPRAGDLSAGCPDPQIIATATRHFGAAVWEFECAHATEVHLQGAGPVIQCELRAAACCVDDGESVFVNSPRIPLLRGFLATTARYLRRR